MSIPCSVIRDLLPLYIAQVCSPETEAEVEAHLKTCDKCRSIYADMIREMKHTTPNAAIPNEKAIYIGIRQKIGNLLLCALLFIGFIGLVFGMMNEIGQHGWPQGVFALAFIMFSCAPFCKWPCVASRCLRALQSREGSEAVEPNPLHKVA